MHHWPQNFFHLLFSFISKPQRDNLERGSSKLANFRSNLEFYTHSPIKNPKDLSLISLNLVLPGAHGLWGIIYLALK